MLKNQANETGQVKQVWGLFSGLCFPKFSYETSKWESNMKTAML